MNTLKKGEFYGNHYQKSAFKNLIITDTKYTHSKVDWHTHENPYFTYLLQGKLFEANKKESYYLKPGSLLFHNWQDAHYNIKPPEFTRGFHIELNNNWFSTFDIQLTDFEGSMNLKSPILKNLMNQIFMETKLNDQYSNVSIESSLIQLFNSLTTPKRNNSKKPFWVNQLKELLIEEQVDYSLHSLSSQLEIHPVHLSREFNRYFGTSLGNYIRLIKLNKAICLLASKKYSLTEVCYQCGFYDQSHFITNFKRIYKTTPSKFLKNLL
ncbi:AraC family transcriptional regulator [Polaribacter sp. Hel_I_88]|uniref:AraC family transcriptional regulator n=1 Tax=Polaribacter sp. Hel_I_88 TaxID=1250006 RepID=UPI00047D9E28|nr:AraC family transcriptional regulator [Polaribacter sp. Hel_I_88]